MPIHWRPVADEEIWKKIDADLKEVWKKLDDQSYEKYIADEENEFVMVKKSELRMLREDAGVRTQMKK